MKTLWTRNGREIVTAKSWKEVIVMRYSTIIEKLSRSAAYGVLPEKCNRKFAQTRFRLWILASNFPNKNGLRKMREVFPSLEHHDLLLKLGESSSIAIANSMVARAGKRISLPLFLLPPKRPAVSKPKPFGIRRQSRRKVVTFWWPLSSPTSC